MLEVFRLGQLVDFHLRGQARMLPRLHVRGRELEGVRRVYWEAVTLRRWDEACFPYCEGVAVKGT